MNLVCRLLPHETADGPHHMALDEALLDAVASAPGLAYFRTYEWSGPTLSLGYFQSAREWDADPRFREAPMVRRATGGGAIWHHHELTYALVLPADHPSARRGGTLYRDVHAAIAGLFRSLGARVERRGAGPPPAPAAARPFLCFTDRDPEDLILAGCKVVGSAQRRRGGAVLQHGSILLARSPWLDEMPGASDLAPVVADPSAWADLLRRHVPAALGLQTEPAAISAADMRHAAELERAVYRTPAWNRRR